MPHAFVLAREGHFPASGFPLAVVRSEDEAWNDLFLCAQQTDRSVHPWPGRAKRKSKSRKRRAKPKGDVESTMQGKPMAARFSELRDKDKDKDRGTSKDTSGAVAGSKRRRARKGDGSEDETSSSSGSSSDEGDPTRHVSKPRARIVLPPEAVFQVLPDMRVDKEGKPFVSTYYSAGKAGSGKSTDLTNFLDMFQCLHPEIPIYGVSNQDISEDDKFKDIKYVQLPIDELVRNGKEFDLEAWFGRKGAFVFMDDVDSTPPEKRVVLLHIIKLILNDGRKLNLNLAVTNHLLRDWNNTRDIIHGSTFISLFPLNTMHEELMGMLTKLGVPKDVRERFREMGEWVTIHNSEPICVISQHVAELF